MSRPTKATVDYFPHFTKHGKSMFILERKFGNTGYAVWFKTLELLGASENHFIDCRNPEDWEFLLAKLGVDEHEVKLIFNCLADIQSISKSLWKNRIIFSENFVKNIQDVYTRRKQLLPTRRVIYSICGIRNMVDVNKNKVSDNRKPQSKVKYSKVKKRIGELKNVKLTEEELKKLIDKFGEVEAYDKVDNLSLYIKSKGDKYKDHYATILSWDRKDKKKNGGTEEKNMPPPINKKKFYLPKGKTCGKCGFFGRCNVDEQQKECTAAVKDSRFYEG